MWRVCWLAGLASLSLGAAAGGGSGGGGGGGGATLKRTPQAPFIADALGNSLPTPSEVPAKVGSPSKLLTPDRYEFYTFDESGELVKRLMTLEEIQAIVAAGDGNDGHLVTFAQDEKPTIAFNFSQPPFTKVHSVVTNVQNVLKSQMEAQKNNPPKPASFDTPDVSNSWSMILPSIFGNTGVDIVPDKLSSNHGNIETVTLETGSKFSSSNENPEYNALSKEDLSDDNTDNFENIQTESKEQNNDNSPSSLASNTHTESTITTTNTHATTPKTTEPTTITTTTELTTNPTTTQSPPKYESSTSNIRILTTTTSKMSTHEINDKYEILSSSNEGQSSRPTKDEITTKVSPQALLNNSEGSPITTAEKNFIAITHQESTDNPQTAQKITSSIKLTTYEPIVSPGPNASNIDIQSNIIVTTYRPSSTSENSKIRVTLVDKPETSYDNKTTLKIEPGLPTTHTTTDITTLAGNNSQVNSQKIEQEVAANNLNASDKNEQELNPAFDVAQSISQIASDLGNSFVAQEDDAVKPEIKENDDLDLPELFTTEKSFEETSSSYTTYNQNVITNSSEKHVPSNESTVDIANIALKIPANISEVDRVISDSMSEVLSQVVDQIPNNEIATTGVSKSTSITTEIPFHRNDENNNVSTTDGVLKNGNNNSDSLVTNNLKNKNYETAKINASIDKVNNASQLNNFVKIPVVISSPQNETVTNNNKISSNYTDGTKIDNLEIIPTIANENNKTTNSKTTNNANDFKSPNQGTKLKNNINVDYYSNYYLNDTFSSITMENKISNKNLTLANKTDLNFISDNQKEETHASNNSSVNNDLSQKNKIFESKKKVQKVNIDDKEYTETTKNDSWRLVSTVTPPKNTIIPLVSDNSRPDQKAESISKPFIQEIANDPSKEIDLESSKENQGLEVTVKNLGEDVYQFTDLCNELAFRYWNAAVENIDSKRSFILSPYSITSMLAMMFMGARGATSGEMNDILKLDDMVTFNPHFTLKNISDSIETTPESGVAVSAFIRELYSDRNRGKLLTFYKERAQHFYSGHVEEINFKLINDIIRRRTNLLVKRYTWGKINEYIKTNNIAMKAPLAAFSANIFQTDCTGSSVEGRDGEMYFVVSPSVRQRRLVPVPAVVYRSRFLAGYDPGLDATAAALGTASSVVTTVLLMPGQQGNTVHADDLQRLERKLLDSVPTAPEWYRLLRTLLPRPGLELQIPRFSHRSVFNVSSALRSMGLRDIFDPAKADLGGLNGPSKDLYLSDMIQSSTFATCAEGPVGEQHHAEEYPETSEVRTRRRTARWTSGWEEPRDYQRAFHDPHDIGATFLPLHLRPRQARLPSQPSPPPPPPPARLKFDRPFLYFVRHNPSGMILYVGRYNPRLLP